MRLSEFHIRAAAILYAFYRSLDHAISVCGHPEVLAYPNMGKSFRHPVDVGKR